jgi:hypothetical protein
VSFGPDGTAGSTFANLQGIAVDQSSGDVYAYDAGEGKVYKFDSAGHPVDFTATDTNAIEGVGGSGAGEDQIAIAPAGAPGGTEGDLYVADVGEEVQIFDGSTGGAVGTLPVAPETCGVAVDPGGRLFTGSFPDAVREYLPSANPPLPADRTAESTAVFSSLCNVAIDGRGAVYGAHYDGTGIEKLSSIGASSATLLDPFATTMALDPGTGDLYADRGDAVAIYDPAGGLIATFADSGPGAISGSYGIAVNGGTGRPGSGDVYVGSGAGQVEIFAPAVLPGAVTGGASAIGPEAATLEGEVDPAGEALTGCRFQFVPLPQFEDSGYTALATAEEAPCAPPFDSIPADRSGHPVGAALTGLAPSSIYHYRLVVENANGSEAGEDATFVTAGPPGISETAVDSVSDTSARLVGLLDPDGQASAWHFQYISAADWLGDGRAYGSGAISVPVPGGTLPAGHGSLFVATAVSGLLPATAYHFRLVATNPSSPPGGTVGPDATFTTRLLPLPPDVRAYELVTPATKPGGQGVGAYNFGGDGDNRPGVAAVGGERYLSGSFAGNLTPGSFLYNEDFALSERVGDRAGWTSHSPFTHHEYATSGGAFTAPRPTASSEDLSVLGFTAPNSGNQPHLFPQMAGWPTQSKVAYLADWQGRWELAAPSGPATGSGTVVEESLSGDGSAALLQTTAHGQLGAGDPSLDQAPGSLALYDDVVPGHRPFLPSDGFAANGVRHLVGVCSGEGGGRTVLPTVEAGGVLTAAPCPPASPGRSEALTSAGGASIGKASGEALSSEDAISADGSSVFFESPDPSDPSSDPPACEGQGDATRCPAQLFLSRRRGDGAPSVSWISRPAVSGQEASLLGPAYFEGASRDGSRVFFRTDSPLTADDPNATGSAPVTTGTASPESWDLYSYEVPGGEDPGDGRLTRISAGPAGTGDCDVSPQGRGAGLRFLSADGTRAYFVCSAPLLGVPSGAAPSDGTITTAGGDPSGTAGRDLYLYDASRPQAQRFEFIARLPAQGAPLASCATTDAVPGQPLHYAAIAAPRLQPEARNCFKGTADGRFVTFMTPGRLLASDPDPDSVDLYGFDEGSDRLIRIDAPQGGVGGSYPCEGPLSAPTGFCNADDGFASSAPLAGVAGEPADPGDHVAFFQTKSRLLPADVNDQYDVYEWDDGRLSLLSTGSGETDAYYSGNGATGRDVFIETPQRLTWQDGDAVMDVYDARIGGGIPEPAPDTPCDVLAGGCRPSPSAAPAAGLPASAGLGGPGNQATPKPRKNPYAKAARRRHRHHHRKHHHNRHRRRRPGHPRHARKGDQKMRHHRADRRAGR